MGAADEIRAGVRQKYEALDAAGLNAQVVEFVLVTSTTGANPAVGKQGTTVERRFILSPKPEVSMNRREGLTPAGTPIQSDADLKGAFPKTLTGREYTNGVASAEVSKSYASPTGFRADMEKAEYFLIDGERFVFASLGFGGGFGSLQVNKHQSEWRLRLARAPEQG